MAKEIIYYTNLSIFFRETRTVFRNLIRLLKSKVSPTIDKLPKKIRANADEIYNFCLEYIKIYEDQTKWEKIKKEEK